MTQTYTQLTLFHLPVQSMDHFAEASATQRGAIFTRHEVVDFILDLAGYTADRPLHTFRLLEPAFGDGAFLFPVVKRLLTAYETHVADRRSIIQDLSGAIRAIEVHGDTMAKTGMRLLQVLREHGIPEHHAHQLLAAWMVEGDFLLVDLPTTFTHAVGNPPYVRQEMIPAPLLAEYRRRYTTIYDRADLYVPFIERSLTSLAPGGVLAFICPDRWMKNRYGGPLRALVSKGYHLVHYVDMVGTAAFEAAVAAYPAIVTIKREKPGPTRVAHRPDIDSDTLARLAASMKAKKVPRDSGVTEVVGVARGGEPWILKSFDRLAVVRRLEAEFPTLEEAGCRVGIGVATGADKVFVAPFRDLDVEPDRKLPLVKTSDIESGNVQWQGLGVVNPFREDGSLVDLAHYPRLARYLNQHADVIRSRHCAQKNPASWYRTIDRIDPELTYRPKLLIPDIKGQAHIVYEDGHFYPHHNLYFITSEEWDLRALQAVLRSGIAELFVSAYSTRMRGGYLRFQAQYLRRIRIPRWVDVPDAIRQVLADAAGEGNVQTCNDAVFELYGLTSREREALGNNDK
jgi:hypothetical protein